MRRRTVALLGTLVVFANPTVGLATPRWGTPRIEPGADAWVIASDIPPFTLWRSASLSPKGGLVARYLGDHPDDLRAFADYEDPARDVYVDVRVVRNGRTEFLDHLIEDAYRSDRTGRLDLPESTLTTVLEQPVYFFCNKPPDCTKRSYKWRSGSNIVVTIEAWAVIDIGPPEGPPNPQPASCPVPTEILQAYLNRYPSSLVLYSDSDERAKQWLREEAALHLAAADYQLDVRVASLPEADQWEPVDAARGSLQEFVQMREAVFRGPEADREYGRLSAARELRPPASVTEMRRLRDEYRQWWNIHQNDPASIP